MSSCSNRQRSRLYVAYRRDTGELLSSYDGIYVKCSFAAMCEELRCAVFEDWKHGTGKDPVRITNKERVALNHFARKAGWSIRQVRVEVV